MDGMSHEEFLAKRRKDDKRREYLIAIGRPSLTSDINVARSHVKRMHEAGMSATTMSQQSGVACDVIFDLIAGRSTQHRASTLTRILAIVYVPPPTVGKGGARTDPTGTLRRLRALVAQGYSARWIAAQLGKARYENRNINNMLHDRKGRNYVYASTALKVALIYDRYAHINPRSLGERESSVKYMHTVARKNGWAPPGCWDPETIDDPSAIAEWTGECGSLAGYRIHYRERIPLCEPCRKAFCEHRVQERLDGKAARDVDVARLAEEGYDAESIATQLGISAGAVGRSWNRIQSVSADTSQHPIAESS